MPAATTHGDRFAPLRSEQSAWESPPRQAPHDDSAALDAAQNAELASLIRNLAAVRPEIFAENPATAVPPRQPPSQPRPPQPRSAGASAAESGIPPAAPPLPPPYSCPHAPAPARPRPVRGRARASAAGALLRPLWHLSAAIGAATVLLGTAAAVLSAARTLPVFGP